eukprot:m.228656 g.228656  ORF g.228656 m.228656 type:complete len:388 (-) comp17552_c0_seq1:53-1216(-)
MVVAIFAFLAIAAFPGVSGVEIEDFWNGNAHFEFVSKARFPTTPGGSYGANVGFQFVPRIVNGVDTWFLFHREYFFAPQPSYCQYDFARIVVRNSTDQGRTWSDKIVVTAPVPNTAQECAIVDGAGYFDEESSTWHYIGQCLDRNHAWNMCHYTRKSILPNGPFVPNPANPVVRGGQLWSQICAQPNAHCHVGMVDEGTPEIVAKINGEYYVTFHGWDAGRVQSARGIARTTDFVHWSVTGGALPGDAIFASIDCNPWNISWAKGGCVGGGEGTMLYSNGYYYHLIEAPDVSLGCFMTVGQQNWVLGLLRSPAFTHAGTWQQPAPHNPTVVPAIKQGCYIQYHRLFQDQTGVYLEFWADNWMQIHKLVSGPGSWPIIAGPPPARRFV